MVFATEDAAFSIDVNMPFSGLRSMFCPNNSNFSGSTMESVNCGVPTMPSSNLICNDSVSCTQSEPFIASSLRSSMLKYGKWVYEGMHCSICLFPKQRVVQCCEHSQALDLKLP